MRITDALNGQTVEDVRSFEDGSVTLYCTSGRVVSLMPDDGKIRLRQETIRLDNRVIPMFSTRMNILQAFQGHSINYVHYDEDGGLVFVCDPLLHDRPEHYGQKALGHREVKLQLKEGKIVDAPAVSAIVGITPLRIFGKGHDIP